MSHIQNQTKMKDKKRKKKISRSDGTFLQNETDENVYF